MHRALAKAFILAQPRQGLHSIPGMVPATVLNLFLSGRASKLSKQPERSRVSPFHEGLARLNKAFCLMLPLAGNSGKSWTTLIMFRVSSLPTGNSKNVFPEPQPEPSIETTA